MKKGFSLITAIIFIVLIAVFSMLSLSLSSQTSKQTSDLYLKAQAELLARSAVEYAVMAVTAHDRAATNDCVNTITATYQNMFNIQVDIRYIGNGLPAGCDIVDGAGAITTPDSQLLAQMDVYVTSILAGTGTTEPIRFHRRTLQRF